MSAGTLAQHGSLHPAGAAGPPQQTQPELSNLIQPTARNTLPLSAAWLCNETPGPALELDIMWCERRTDADTGPCRPGLGWVAETCCISGATNLGPINHDFCSPNQTPNPLDLYSPQHVSPNRVTAQRFSASFDGILGFPAELFSLPPGMRSSSQS